MSQLGKGGKWVFGWVVVRAGKKITVPPEAYSEYGFRAEEEKSQLDSKLLKAGLLVALGITIHNIPEGIAVGAGYMRMPEFGFLIALGIACTIFPKALRPPYLCLKAACHAGRHLELLYSLVWLSPSAHSSPHFF